MDSSSQNRQNHGIEKKTMGIVILEGLRPINFYTLFWCSMVMLIGITCVPAISPIFLEKIIKVNPQHFGKINTSLVYLNDVVAILFLGLSGALSDKYGRKILLTMGLFFSGLFFILLPHSNDFGNVTSTSALLWVYSLRFLFAVALTFAWPQVFTLIGDYTEHKSRGKGNAIVGFMSGLGAALTFPMVAIISKKFGVHAGFYTCGGIFLVTALIAHLGIVDRLPKDISRRKKTVEMLKEATDALKTSSGLKFSYAASFISRASVGVLGTIMMQWVVTAAASYNMDSHQANAKGGIILGIFGLSGLLSSFIWGILLDKWGRMPAVTLSLVLNTIGFGLLGFLTDPFSGLTKLFAVFCGLGQVGLMVTSTTLAIDLSPRKVLGSVLGGFNTLGAVGILVLGIIGGFLFDEVSYSSPFILVSIVSLFVLFWAIVVYKKVPKITGKRGAASVH